MGAIVFSFVLVWSEFLIELTLTTSDAETLPVVASEMTSSAATSLGAFSTLRLFFYRCRRSCSSGC